jgi:hypothetical protein
MRSRNVKPPTRIGLETCQDLYDKLRFEAQRLETGWNIYDTFNFVVTAHHLYVDWIPKRGTEKTKAKKQALPTPAKKVLQSIIDLSNGSKHWQVDRATTLERQVITAKPTVGINDWHAYMLAGPMLYVEMGEYKLSMRELRDLVLGYFEWMLDEDDGELPAKLNFRLLT